MKKSEHKNSVKLNYLYNMMYQVLLLVLPLIVAPYVARVLGANGVGITGYTISVVTFFILFGSLGISVYGQREISYYQNNKEEQSKIFFELIALKIIAMTLSMILFYFMFARTGEYAMYYKILIIEMVANVFDITWFYQGIERFKKIAFRNGIIKILSAVAVFIFIKNKSDINNYLYISCFNTLLSNISLWINVKKYLVIPERLEIFKHLKKTILLFIPQIAIKVYTVLDKIMIGSILNNMTQVGYYEETQKIIRFSLIIVTAMGTAMLPRISSCFAENDHKRIKEYIYKGFNFALLLSIPMTLGMIAIAKRFVPSFFGNEFAPAYLLLIIMSVITILIGLSNVIGVQYLLPTKKEKYYTISVTIGAVINFVLNYILIQKYQAIGAAIATVIAEFMVTATQFYYVRKDFKIFEIIKLSKNYWIAGIIMFIIVNFLVNTTFVFRSATIIITSGIGALIYVGILLLLKDEFLLDTIKSVKKMVKNK